MDKDKIIQFANYFKSERTQWVGNGVDALNMLEPDEMNAAVEFILNYVFVELKVGLGLLDPPNGSEPPDIADLKIFNKIADIYDEVGSGCYFCDNSVDPNEDEFGPETSLCMMCKVKLGNYTEALGIPAGKVFPGMDRQFIQKKHIKMK